MRIHNRPQKIETMKLRRVVSAIVLVALAIATALYFKPAADRSEMEASNALTAGALYAAMAGKTDGENSTYLDQVISISGNVIKQDGQVLILEPGIACRLEAAVSGDEWKAGDVVQVKGRVLGYDDMYDEVQVDFAVVE